MPGDGFAFTTRVEPISPPQIAGTKAGEKLVEAPGTAPGSATLISQAVYRHSRLPDEADIGSPARRRNPGRNPCEANLKIAVLS